MPITDSNLSLNTIFPAFGLVRTSNKFADHVLIHTDQIHSNFQQHGIKEQKERKPNMKLLTDEFLGARKGEFGDILNNRNF